MSRDCPRCRRRHGIATLLAITLIGLVGASLAGMTAYSACEVRRSRALADDARLRQLLLAGAADVLSRSRAGISCRQQENGRWRYLKK